jgi:hydrogenase expression/formation protein HypE
LVISESFIERCKGFLNQISILKEAEIATKSGMVTAMHDVTEGGLATALTELSVSGNT